MRFTNTTRLPAGWTLGFERDGRELLVVIVKATYVLPADGGEPVLAEQQQALVEEDRFTAEPGFSSPLVETDYAHRKPGCDVIVVGSAHAPGGRPVKRLTVGLKVGTMVKQFAVVGDRWWRQRLGGVAASEPEPFVSLPLSYDVAFGGTDRREEAQGRTDTYLPNPVGRGYCRHASRADDLPLPNTEALDQPVRAPDDHARPMALSPIGRNWAPRAAYAGTYDQHWIENTAPLWPEDFDPRYFQCAPPDQVVPYLAGGEEVVLQHLTPDGRRAFRLPALPMPVTFIPHKGRDAARSASVDTLVLETDAGRMTLTWRCPLPLAGSVFDVKEVVVGELPLAWHRQRQFPGKTYLGGLGALVAQRAEARR